MGRLASTGHTKRTVTAAAAAVLAACAHDHTTAPLSVSACGAGGVVQLAPLQAATVSCDTGTALLLAGGGARYLVVAQLATGNVANRSVPYLIGVGEGALASLSPAPSAVLDSRLPTAGSTLRASSRGPDGWQRTFDARLLAEAQRQLATGAWRIPRQSPAAKMQVPAPSRAQANATPAVGDLHDFHVLSSNDPRHPLYTPVAARLGYVGTNILLYVDTLAPANGFTASQLQSFGQLFDQTLYPLVVSTFGTPSDVDQNGRLVMMLSPVVNELSPQPDCDTQGFVGGFFSGYDLIGTDTSSNRGEIFYSVVPDPNGTVSCAHTVSDLLRDTPAIFNHELQHLINFSQHVIAHGGNSEEGWLDEGMSIVAEELGSLYYEQKFPPPSGRTNPAQLFPDSSQGFINGLLVDSYEYLLKTDTATVTLHSDADDGIAWRGGDWLLLRWLGDQKGVGFYKQLEQNTLRGTANIAAAAGESFASLFGDFSLALYADSVPGIAKSAIPPRNRFVVRNLRQMYQRLFDTSQPSSLVPRPFPIAPVPLTGTLSASMVPGTMAFYRVDTNAGQTSVRIQFAAPGGTAPLSAGLNPQLSVFRLPPGS